MTTDRILLEGLSFYGYHGALPAERELGQPFVVDCVLSLNLRPAGQTDDLRLTVDYGAVFRSIEAIVVGRPVRLLETVAQQIADSLLSTYPIDEVWIRVTKPRAPVRGTSFGRIGVEISRKRP